MSKSSGSDEKDIDIGSVAGIFLSCGGSLRLVAAEDLDLEDMRTF